MLSFFTRRFKANPSQQGEVQRLYNTLMHQARLPHFYANFGVADTVEGRLEMIYLHLFMIFHRLRDENTPLKQDLFDYFVAQTDANLREMSVGDLKVPKLMKAVGLNFYGRSKAYTAALVSSEAMQAALNKNISLDNAPSLSDYVFITLETLQGCTLNDLPNFVFKTIKEQ